MSNERIIRAARIDGAGSTLVLGAGEAAATAKPEPIAAVGPDKAQLRTLFAEELNALKLECRQQAEREGYAAGKKAAEAAAEAEQLRALAQQRVHDDERRQAVESLQTAAVNLLQARNEYLRGHEAVLVELACSTVLKMLGEAAALRSLVPALVATALEQASSDTPVQVRLCPADFERMQQAGDEQALAPALAHIDFVADAQLGPGDCHVDSPAGSLDASLDTQLRAFRDLLLTTYAHGQDGKQHA